MSAAGTGTLSEPIEDVVRALDGTDLRPGADVDALFSRLVGLALQVDGDHPMIRDPAALAHVRRICALGEAHLEDFWADQVLADPARLTAFPYLDNYRELARAEYRALSYSCATQLRTVVFAGCGPLPLTALELAKLDPDLRIVCLDVDPDVAEQARRVVAALAPPGHGLRIVLADAGRHHYRDADAVLVAALVGADIEEKLSLLDRIAGTLAPGVLLAARSVPDDGRKLLYPRIDPARAAGGSAVTVIGEWLPPPRVINSLLLMSPSIGTVPSRGRLRRRPRQE